MRAAAAPWLVLAVFHTFHAAITPLPPPVRAEITGRSWHAGCPVPLSGLRLLTVTYWGFDRRTHTGQIVVNANAAAPLEKVFHRLYDLHFPVHHLDIQYSYGPAGVHRPPDGDFTASFSCRQAVPSPCSGGTGTGSWSQHAYGEAVDLNPVENPYVGCGMTRDKTALRYVDRSRRRRAW